MMKKDKLKLLSSSFIFLFISGCATHTAQPPQSNPRQPPEVNSPKKQIPKEIPPKSNDNDLSPPQQKNLQKASLGLIVANDKYLPGALVLNFDSFKGISPAEESGINRGDIIITIGSCDVKNTSTYFSCLDLFKPKDVAFIKFNRDGIIYKTRAKLADRY